MLQSVILIGECPSRKTKFPKGYGNTGFMEGTRKKKKDPS